MDPRHQQVVGLVRQKDPKVAGVMDSLLQMPEGPYVMDNVLLSRANNVPPMDYYTARYLAEDFLTQMRWAVPPIMATQIDAAMSMLTPLYMTPGGETKKQTPVHQLAQTGQVLLWNKFRYGRPMDAHTAQQMKAAKKADKNVPLLAKAMNSWMYQAVSMTVWSNLVYSQTESPATSLFVSIYLRPKIERYVFGKIMGHIADTQHEAMEDQARGLNFLRSYTPRQWSEQVSPSIKEKSVALVNNLSNGAEKTLQQSMTRAVQEGWNERRAARWYSETYSLDPRSEQALANYEKSLLGQQVPYTRREALIRDKAAQLRAVRAKLIAETETFSAMNAGRTMVTTDAIRRGALPADALLVWITADDERVCMVCGPMHGVKAKPLEMWSMPNGKPIASPPAHPRCRCTVLPAVPTTSSSAKIAPELKQFTRDMADGLRDQIKRKVLT